MIVLVVDIIICVHQIKKSKIKHDDESWGSKNKFQSYQNKRNLNKF